MAPLGKNWGILGLVVFAVVLWVGGTSSVDENSEVEVEEDLQLYEKTWKTGGGDRYPKFIVESGEKEEVRIGSFNLQKFGRKKAANEEVLKIIAKIIARYDLIALQEITDVKEKSINTLMEAISKQSNDTFHLVISPRVGRTRQKEQYGLVFRPDIFKVEKHILFDDSEGDAFVREPQLALIKLKSEKIAIVNVHIQPSNAPAEITALSEVHAWVETNWGIDDILILGDLNAACDYMRKRDIPNIPLFVEPKYKWLISNRMDTTVGKKSCAYDRIIISGSYLTKNLKPGSAGPFEFDREFGYYDLAKNVSDHYPVEFSIWIKNEAGILLSSFSQLFVIAMVVIQFNNYVKL